MTYSPHTDADRATMLAAIGARILQCAELGADLAVGKCNLAVEQRGVAGQRRERRHQRAETRLGTLLSIYVFLSLICELTGLVVATASHYDGATATAEAALMACRLTRRDRIAVSAGVSPDTRRVLATYCSGPGSEIVTVPIDLAQGGTGTTDPAVAAAA